MTDLLIHLHIPKTGGTSLDEFLARIYGDAYRRISGYSANEKFWSLPPDDLNALECVGGHLAFGVHRHFPGRQAKYIAFVRRPVDRLYSLYWHIRSRKANVLHETTLGVSFDEWARLELVSDIDNGMTRYFAGRMQFGVRPSGRPVSETDYLLACRNIDDHFGFVGVFEEYAASFRCMAKLYGFSGKTGHLLQAQGRPKIDSLHDYGWLIEKNRWDVKLYHYLLRRYEEN